MTITLTPAKKPEEVKEEFIQDIISDPYLEKEGKAREDMILGFLQKGTSDKSLTRLIQKYLKASLTKDENQYRILNVLMGKLDKMVIHEAKKGLDKKKMKKDKIAFMKQLKDANNDSIDTLEDGKK